MEPQIRRIQAPRTEAPSPLRRRLGARRSDTFRIEPAGASGEQPADAGERDAGASAEEERQVAPRADDEAGAHLDVTA